MERDELTAETLDLSQYATHGFCPQYPLKRHRHEALANAGCLEARRDWARYIGPACEFGGCNPINGNFTALVLPLCKPQRLKLVAYLLEYAFLHDSVVENLDSQDVKGNEFSLGDRESTTPNVKTGREQMQAKMKLKLKMTSLACATRIMEAWKTMLSTTLRDKSKDFADLDEYLDFRIIDSGALFVESIMLFGMDMTLTKDEDALLADIVRPCYASQALANDYFSFDCEWAEAQSKPGAAKPMNAVWLYMRWRGVNTAVAKRLVVEATNRYEKQFLELCEQFRREHAPIPPKLDLYLRALSYQISGNVVWSLNCPRYHPEFRYDPNAGLEDAITAEQRGRNSATTAEGEDPSPEKTHPPRQLSVSTVASSDWDMHSYYSWSSNAGSASSPVAEASDAGDEPEPGAKPNITIPGRELLGSEHLDAAFSYMKSLPSKGVRDAMADALNLWAALPENTLAQIKGLVGDLHTASLMNVPYTFSTFCLRKCNANNGNRLDDIEDGSDLRRGHPAAHSVFGVPQTINAASFAIVEALRKAHELSDTIPRAAEIAFEQLRDLHVGQSYDLHWTRHASTPTDDEYLEMVSKKTGGLFGLLSRLMCSHLDSEVASAIDNFVKQFGIYFQIRDDYKNLHSEEYTKQKGFCEDLDEGKLSFPLVHHLTTAPQATDVHVLQVREVLAHRRESGSLTDSHKKLVLQHLQASKSVEYTWETLKKLESQIDGSIARLERLTGKENWCLRLCMHDLSV
ncbi:isoprenoid synthase domain-containing protein [Achaetomium macrosporum]|uniref:Isoprenoid synthase domain-containing protein n=1 Tax=Achaetomium macrosporum TaxID=79813 RepID=A0AAN7C9M0_9PEZI|nr:isoprenoid synthase domain-containing protein [Achaetomium macrosporum]